MNSVTGATGWKEAPLGTSTDGRQGTKAGERGGRRAPDAIRTTEAEWLAARMASAINRLDAMPHDEIAGLNVDAFIVGSLLGYCDPDDALSERISELRGIAIRAGKESR